MGRLKAQILRLYGDHGAETLDRYFAQIEYTAYWCIRMLRRGEGIIAVIPEGIEDVVIERLHCFELHQVKTRDESRGPWPTSEVVPILCAQYHRRGAFAKECSFHFVSDRMADSKPPLRASAFRPLYRLKWLLSIQQSGQDFSPEEQAEFDLLKLELAPAIRQIMLKDHHETLDDQSALRLLYKTCIETDCHTLRQPSNLVELEHGLAEALPGAEPCTMPQLRDMYDNLLLTIIRRIREGVSLEDRRLEYDDVLSCRTMASIAAAGYPDLGLLPGSSVLDKKALLGGFDATELPTFHRQKQNAEYLVRKLKALDLDEALQQLTGALLDLHWDCRNRVCRNRGINHYPGPHILAALRDEVEQLPAKYCPGVAGIDGPFCLGVLWRETNECAAWWHGFDSNASGQD